MDTNQPTFVAAAVICNGMVYTGSCHIVIAARLDAEPEQYGFVDDKGVFWSYNKAIAIYGEDFCSDDIQSVLTR